LVESKLSDWLRANCPAVREQIVWLSESKLSGCQRANCQYARIGIAGPQGGVIARFGTGIFRAQGEKWKKMEKNLLAVIYQILVFINQQLQTYPDYLNL
jgi:hypothetical protein